jgi:hypothetical protein
MDASAITTTLPLSNISADQLRSSNPKAKKGNFAIEIETLPYSHAYDFLLSKLFISDEATKNENKQNRDVTQLTLI